MMATTPHSPPLVTQPSWRESVRIWKRILGLLRPHWRSSVGSVIYLILSTGFALLVPWLLKYVIDTGISSGKFSDLLIAAVLVLVASILRGVFAYGQGYLSQNVSVAVAYDLRNLLYDHLQKLSFSFHDKAETGQLMSHLTADIEGIRNAIPLGILRIAIVILYFGSVSIILATLDIRLALVTLLCVPALAVLAYQVTRRLRPLWDSVQSGTGDLSTVMQESLSGRRVVMSFAREDFEITKFDEKNQELRNVMTEAARLSAWNQPLMVLVLNVITVAVLWVGGILVIGHSLTVGTLFAIVQYALLLGTPVRTFGFMINNLMRGSASGQRIFAVLDTEPQITDKPDAVDLASAAGHVRFEHVSFAYTTGREVLSDIDIDAQPGQVIALLGATGSGKSTILSLLPRFYDVSNGSIAVDGHDVRDLRMASLRHQIGFILQDVFLFNATLRDNIAFGVNHATDAEIAAAAKVARLDDFVASLPEGYDTWVGERGVTLSGGQKQRVAIARTILMNPRILVLDDSTSSVDMETEYLIQEALDAVMRGRTTFVVASRLRTIKHAHQILVLDQGRIVERGTHSELLALGGIYTRLYDVQLRDQEEFEAEMIQSHQPESTSMASDQIGAAGLEVRR